jgi:hypothetical protein
VIAVAALAFPVFLLLLVLAMDRVEEPLREAAIGDHLAEFFETAHPDDVERFIREGLATPLDRYWRRRGRRSKVGNGRHATG